MDSAHMFTVALTGGPSGGKSTTQMILSDVLENLGYKVYRIPEVATIMLSVGVLFQDLDAGQRLKFQENLLRVMLSIEQTYFDLAESNWTKNKQKTVIICDRGAMDPSAYIDKPEWTQIMSLLHTNESSLRDTRYDMVVHLVTAADGAEQFYSNQNNVVRSEDVPLARSLDLLIKRAWLGHPYLVVVDNSTDFKQKTNRVIQAVLQRMGLDDKRWGNGIRKHKFLVKPNTCLNADALDKFSLFTVIHTYLAQTEGGPQVRIRERVDEAGCSFYSMTTRSVAPLNSPDDQVIEQRRLLTPRDYNSLMNQASPIHHSITKKRQVFLHSNCMFQLDTFTSISTGLVLLEAYLPTSGNDVSSYLPPFIEIVRDVTRDPNYSLSHLALK